MPESPDQETVPAGYPAGNPDPVNQFLYRELTQVLNQLKKLEAKLEIEFDPTQSLAERLEVISEGTVLDEDDKDENIFGGPGLEVKHLPNDFSGICNDCIATVKLQGAQEYVDGLIKQSERESPGFATIRYLRERSIISLQKFAATLGLSPDQSSPFIHPQ